MILDFAWTGARSRDVSTFALFDSSYYIDQMNFFWQSILSYGQSTIKKPPSKLSRIGGFVSQAYKALHKKRSYILLYTLACHKTVGARLLKIQTDQSDGDQMARLFFQYLTTFITFTTLSRNKAIKMVKTSHLTCNILSECFDFSVAQRRYIKIWSTPDCT